MPRAYALNIGQFKVNIKIYISKYLEEYLLEFQKYSAQ